MFDSLPIGHRLLSEVIPSRLVRLTTHWKTLSCQVLRCGCLLVLMLGLLWSQPALAGLAPGNAITDARTLLRYALPLNSSDIREVQAEVEAIGNSLRAKRWSPIRKNVDQAYRILQLRSGRILDATPAENRVQVSDRLQQLKTQLLTLQAVVKAENKELVSIERRNTLIQIGEIEEKMVGSFPFEIPAEYAQLPRLLGRATIKFTTELGAVTAIVDGYSAPLTAGNFVDLVQKGFYDGLPITRAEEFYILQLGDPAGTATGFIDPATGQERTIPLEILVAGDEEPIYGFTLESLGLYQDPPALPFSAFGTMGKARPNNDPDGGSSQFFFFLFEPELTPAGFNLLDGRYAAFGYVIDGQEILYKLKKSDRILQAEVIEGANNLVIP